MNRLMIRRLIVPAGAAAGLSFMFTRHDVDTSPTTYWMKQLSDAFEAVKNGQQANYKLLKQIEESFVNGKLSPPQNSEEIDASVWCLLALHKSSLTKLHQVLYPDKTFDDDDFDEVLHKLKLDKIWTAALNWYSINLCSEGDLGCEDTAMDAFKQKPSKVQRLITLMQVLLYRTEVDSSRKLIEQNLLQALLNIFRQYHETQKELSIIVLKVLANIAQDGKLAADHIVNSEWFSTLVSLLNQPYYDEEEILAHKIFVNLLYSYGYESHKLTPSIYELHRPELGKEPVMDIVFVHGLRGSAFRTWRQQDQKGVKTTRFWPRSWLSNDIKAPVRILALDYTSRLISFQVMETITDRSRKFQQSFKYAGIGTRPVIFICHSMGGLLIKNMLLENEALREKTVGVLFAATPHKGSPVATAFSYNLLRPTEDVKLLREENEINRKLHKDFLGIVDSIPIITTLIEQKATPVGFGTSKTFVTQESASFGRGSLYHIPEHHHNCCKPKDRNHPSYCVMLNFVKDALHIINQI